MPLISTTLSYESRVSLSRSTFQSWREPTVRLEPFFTPRLCLLVLIDELWVRHVLEFTHEHPRTGRLLGQQDEPAAQEDEETRDLG